MKRRIYYILSIIVLSLILSLLVSVPNIAKLESFLLNVSTIFLGVAITLYALTSSILLPMLSDNKEVFTRMGMNLDIQIKGFSGLLEEIFQGIIVILSVFLISFIFPLIKSRIQIMFENDPEVIIFLLRKGYIAILLAGFFLIFFVIWDIVRAIKKLNDLHLLLIAERSKTKEHGKSNE